MRRRWPTCPHLAIYMLSWTFCLPSQAVSQVPDSLNVPPPPSQEAAVADSVAPGGISPRGAFIRSALVPGWGHAEVGAYVRGGFYFGAQTATAFMVAKSHTRFKRAGKRLRLAERVVTARLSAQGVTDPAELESALAEDPVVEDLRALRDSRSEQREDWIALGVFFIFLGGADAYVSAHLANFPVAVEVGANPAGGVEVSLGLPAGF